MAFSSASGSLNVDVPRAEGRMVMRRVVFKRASLGNRFFMGEKRGFLICLRGTGEVTGIVTVALPQSVSLLSLQVS